MRITVVVVHFRFWPGIRDCLDAVAAQRRRPDAVVVVDDQSGDGHVAGIRSAYPELQVVEQPRNRGYAAAVNAGIAHAADADAVLVLTHEAVLEPDALGLLESTMTGTGAAVVGPLLGRLDDRRLWSAGGALGRRSSLPYHLTQPRGAAPYPVAWVDGAAYLVERDAWSAAGGLDEAYFLYVEEVDFMQRLMAQGRSVVVDPRARAWQQPGMTPPYLEARNVGRWLARTRRWGPLLVHVSRQLVLVARAVRRPATRWETWARLAGLRDIRRGQEDRRWALMRSPA